MFKAVYNNDLPLLIDLGGLDSMDINFRINEDGIFPLYIACIRGQ